MTQIGTISGFAVINGVTVKIDGVLSDAALPPEELPAENGLEWTPNLQANSYNGYVASATSEYVEGSVTCSAFKAFNQVSGGAFAYGWSSNAKATQAAPQILNLTLPAAKVCYSYSIKIRTDISSIAPTEFTFEGFDGTTWQVLDTRSGLTWTAGEAKVFDCATPGKFSKYRWRITGSGVYCQIDEIKLWS